MPRRRQGRRPARPGLRPAGPHRRRSSRTRSAPAGRARPNAATIARRAASRRTRRSPKAGSGWNRSTRRWWRAPSPTSSAPSSLDPRYAAAHVGLGNARFLQYQMSRARNQPDGALLARAIDHVRRAIELERDLAEAHATLAFLLVSAGRSVEALAAARRAVALEPGYWGNQFRLAHAAWGDERLQAVGADDGAVSGFSVRALRGGDGAYRARHARPRRIDASRGHHRPGPPGAPEAALSGQGTALAARPRPAGARRRRGSAAGVRSGNRAGCRAALRDRSSR